MQAHDVVLIEYKFTFRVLSNIGELALADMLGIEQVLVWEK